MGEVCDWVEMTVKSAIASVGVGADAVMLIFLLFPLATRIEG
jgi:hypothetical protein